VVSSGTTGLARFRSVSAHNTKHAGVNRIIDYANNRKIAMREKRQKKSEKIKGRFRRGEIRMRKSLVLHLLRLHATSEIKSKKLPDGAKRIIPLFIDTAMDHSPFLILVVSVMKEASCICSCQVGLCRLSVSLPVAFPPTGLARVRDGGGIGVLRFKFRR